MAGKEQDYCDVARGCPNRERQAGAGGGGNHCECTGRYNVDVRGVESSGFIGELSIIVTVLYIFG